MRILLAGVIGAIAMFIWTSFAHMALPLGEAGIGEIPNESVVLSAMQSSMNVVVTLLSSSVANAGQHSPPARSRSRSPLQYDGSIAKIQVAGLWSVDLVGGQSYARRVQIRKSARTE